MVSASIGLLLIAVNAVFVGTDDSSDFQKSLPALVVWAVPGKDVELPCDIKPEDNDSVSMVLWFKDNVGIPVYSLDARDGPLSRATHWAMSNDLGSRTNFLVGKNTGPSRLRINRVIPSDQGIFRCRIDFNNSPTKNIKVNLTLIEQPSEPIIYDAQGREVIGVAGPFKEGYDLFLSCHVVGGRPRPNVTWWDGDRLLDSTLESVTPTLVVNQYFRVKVNRTLFNTNLQCRASVLDAAPALVKDIRIEVYLKPQEVNVTLLTQVLTSGRPQQYLCETWGSVPPARITWLLEDEPIRNATVTVSHDSNVTQSVFTYRPSSVDNGKELTCRAENPRFLGSIMERKVKLTVLYPPKVSIKRFQGSRWDTLKEGSEIRLFCDVDANPKFEEIFWFHGDQRVVQNHSLGVIKSGRKLELINLTREQAGEYSCGARNSEGEGRSEAISVSIQYAPRCKDKYRARSMGALRRDTLTVRCEVTANPSEDVRFSWTFNKSGDVLPVQPSRVTSSRLSSHVEFTPISESDFGTLACWASNSVGRQTEPCMTHIFPARVPEPPKDCRLLNHTSGVLELTCIADHDGGLQQHFMLEGIEADRDNAVVHPSDAPGFKMLGSQPTFVLRGLQPGKSYQLSVFAINAKGRSDPPVVISGVNIEDATARLTSTEKSENTGEEDERNPMVIILGTLVAVALLIIAGIAVAAALVLCKKRTANENNLCSNYDENIEETLKEIPKNESAFIVKVPKRKKLNNREVAPPELDEKALQLVQEVQKRNSIAKANRQSTLMNNIDYADADDSDRRNSAKETRLSSVNNLKNGGKDAGSVRNSTCEDPGRRSHPRVTLSPEGQVMRCVMTEVPDSDLRTVKTPAKTD